MTNRRKRLLNEYEEVTHEILEKAASEYGARVLPKVRLADVMSIDNSGITNEEFSYALKSHFDFDVVDDDWKTKFVVEFDGNQHNTDAPTVYRDTLKNRLCEKFNIPILRIDIGFHRQVERFSLLGWLIHVWFLNEDFVRQQSEGSIDPFEIFNYSFIISEIRDGVEVRNPYDPFIRSRVKLQHWRQEGVGRQRFPERPRFALDPRGYAVDVTVFDLANGQVIIGVGRCRSYNFAPVHPSELATELSVYDAAQKVEQYLKGEYRPSDPSEAEEWEQTFERWAEYR